MFTQIVCTYCGRQLTCEERVKNGFGIYKLNEKTGHLIEEHEVNNKKRSHTQLDSRKQVIAFQDRVITINIKEAQHPLK